MTTTRSSRWSTPGSCSGLIPRSELHIYRGGHLELAADAGRLAATVEAFLDADPAPEESQP